MCLDVCLQRCLFAYVNMSMLVYLYLSLSSPCLWSCYWLACLLGLYTMFWVDWGFFLHFCFFFWLYIFPWKVFSLLTLVLFAFALSDNSIKKWCITSRYTLLARQRYFSGKSHSVFLSFPSLGNTFACTNWIIEQQLTRMVVFSSSCELPINLDYT